MTPAATPTPKPHEPVEHVELPPPAELSELLAGWLPRQRWFGGKGREISEVRVAERVVLQVGEPHAEFVLITVSYAGNHALDERYQVLMGRRATLPPELEHIEIGPVTGGIAYDGLWDRDLSALLLDELADGAAHGAIRFVPEPGAKIPRGTTGRVMAVEQSNSSLDYGEQLILKLFRRVWPGVNPDLELHRALREVGSEHIAQLRGAIEGTVDGQPATLAMLSDFASNSAEGWAMALISVRDLLAEGDLHAAEVGGDFAGEAYRLGEAVAAVHADLARALGTGAQDPGALAAAMADRLAQATTTVPELGVLGPAIRESYAALAARPEPVPTQRVHGDLHLGQTLRTPKGWLVIDFEGEPSRPVAERSRPDSALRDVAGMLRSFDYAAHHQLLDWKDGEEPDAQLSWHAREWSKRNRDAFCDGYATTMGVDPRADAVLLRAYELDKAVYETVYEARNRPTWLSIPLGSIARLAENGDAN